MMPPRLDQQLLRLVDFRLLRAVAIEHTNDVDDAAAEFVITEVLSIGEVSKDDAQVDSFGVKVEVDTVSSESKDPPAAGGSIKDIIYVETDDDEEENGDDLSRPKLGSSKEIILVETNDEEGNDDHLSRPKRMIHYNSPVRSDDDRSALSELLVGVPGYRNEPNSTMKQGSLGDLFNAAIKSEPDHYTEQINTNCVVDNVILHDKLYTQSADTSLSNVDADTSVSSNVIVMDGFAMNSASGMQTTQSFSKEGNVGTFFSNNVAGSLLSYLSEKDLSREIIRSLEDSEELPQCSFQSTNCQNFVMSETNGPSVGVDCAQGEDASRSSGNDMLDSSRGSDDIGNLTSMVDACDEQHSLFLNESSADLLHLEAAMLSSHEDYQNATTAAQSSLFAGVEFLDSSVSDAKTGKANAALDMAMNDDCKLKFLELKLKRTYRYIIYKIDLNKEEVIVEKHGEPTETYEEFTSSLPADECRYCIYDFDFVTADNCQKSRIFFIAWSPDAAKVRNKMLYTSSKGRIKRELAGFQMELQATDPTEMDIDVIRSRAMIQNLPFQQPSTCIGSEQQKPNGGSYANQQEKQVPKQRVVGLEGVQPRAADTTASANLASGMAVNDDCKLTFLELKSKRTYRYIIYKIDLNKKEVIVEKHGEPMETYEEFTSSLPADECRYCIYDFDFVTSENCQKSRIFFIAWSPAVAKVRSKMLYASSKDGFKRELDGFQVVLQATDPTEMDIDAIRSRAN